MSRRLGATAQVLAIACIVTALVKHETRPTVAFGALDRPGAAVAQPNLAPWLIAAGLLVALATVLLLRHRR